MTRQQDNKTTTKAILRDDLLFLSFLSSKNLFSLIITYTLVQIVNCNVGRSRVVGGAEARPGQFPHQVVISNSKTRLNMLFSPTLPQLENIVQQTEQPAT